MKVYIHEHDLYPCYSVSLKPGTHESVVNVPEDKIQEWKDISRQFFQMQNEIEQAIRQYEFAQEELTHLKSCFADTSPSRTDKGYILNKFGWKQIDTSLWEKDNRQLRLHEAYEECKQNFWATDGCTNEGDE